MTVKEERARKAKLITELSSLRYGPMTLRALCVIALDIRKIHEMRDEELLKLPGIGLKSLAGIRRHLADYYNEE